MTDIFIIGAEKFALEVASYVECARSPDRKQFKVAGFLSLEGELVATPGARTVTFKRSWFHDRAAAFVFAVSDPARRAVMRSWIGPELRDRFPPLVHETANVACSARIAPGALVGPFCRVGVNAVIGAFTILNYQCGVGHHSRIGERVFLAPGFQCGNSAVVGDGCFFGLSCVVCPSVAVGPEAHVLAGTCLTENLASGMLAFSSSRMKSIQRTDIYVQQ
ncbi:DapH/DapD/GlmU-related protein [Bradyrhizobium sp. ARR65]|uniref:DapH/DapD/GlmU-related protein n=1 Tax=Bradyrhizobium sp. ARR65 TaxID=1040989 RepID=UPI000467A57A|nr:DapH/DapD/GlmU-related protein [Bradyrhizobium sp. ARR65]